MRETGTNDEGRGAAAVVAAFAEEDGARLVGRVLGIDATGGGDLVRATIDRLGWTRLARRDPDTLSRETGWPRDACERLAAGFALGRRVEAERYLPRTPLRDPAGVHRFLRPLFRGLEREQFHVLLLDGKHRLRRVALVSEGTLTTSLVHPREVFRDAVRASAAAVMVAHNHPSGDPEPSREDLEVTERLARAGRLLGIPLLDHLVVAEGGFTSLRARGWVRED